MSVAPSNLHSCNVLRGKATADSRRLHTTRDLSWAPTRSSLFFRCRVGIDTSISVKRNVTTQERMQRPNDVYGICVHP